MNATKFCHLVEAQLGWEVSATSGPAYLRYGAEVAKVKRRIASNPDLYTWENLLLALALLRREKQSRSPLGVMAHVERALDLALDREVDVEVEIRAAVAHETAIGDPNGWVERLARATGIYRAEALAEWRAEQC